MHKFKVGDFIYWVVDYAVPDFERASDRGSKLGMMQASHFVTYKGSVAKNAAVSGEVLIDAFIELHGEKYQLEKSNP